MTDPTPEPLGDASSSSDTPSADTPSADTPSADATPSTDETPQPRDSSAMSETEVEVLESLKSVIDPELMVNIVDLGLIYDVRVDGEKADVSMTLTSPACPAGPQIVHQAKMAVESHESVADSEIRLTMSPPWTPERMTDDARDQLGIF